MKTYLGVAMAATLLLSACAQPKPDAPATANGAAADQTQVATDAAPKKKKCSDQTGSRLAPCGDGATGDYVQGSSGESYKENNMRGGGKMSPN